MERANDANNHLIFDDCYRQLHVVIINV